MTVTVTFDEAVGTLYVRRSVARWSRTFDDDGSLILSEDAEGSVVGLILLEADKETPAVWASRGPQIDEIPLDLRSALEGWITARTSP